MKSTILTLVTVLLASGVGYSQLAPATKQSTREAGRAEVAGWLADYKGQIGKV